MRKLDKVKKVFIRSGIRYDYLMADSKCDAFIEELCRYHVSGTLKVAPEHVSKNVLGYMHKAPKKVFLEFAAKYKETNKRLGMKQYLIPYLISSHPGSTLKDAVELTMEPVYVAKTMEEKKMQRALIHFHKRENSRIVAAALKKAGREDLIPVLSSHKYHTRKHK